MGRRTQILSFLLPNIGGNGESINLLMGVESLEGDICPDGQIQMKQKTVLGIPILSAVNVSCKIYRSYIVQALTKEWSTAIL